MQNIHYERSFGFDAFRSFEGQHWQHLFQTEELRKSYQVLPDGTGPSAEYTQNYEVQKC